MHFNKRLLLLLIFADFYNCEIVNKQFVMLCTSTKCWHNVCVFVDSIFGSYITVNVIVDLLRNRLILMLMRCVNTTESAGLNPLLITVNEANSVLLYIWTVDYLQAVLEELLSRFFQLHFFTQSFTMSSSGVDFDADYPLWTRCETERRMSKLLSSLHSQKELTENRN